MSERCKNFDWKMPRGVDGNFAYDAAQLAVMMDIRDELKQLNRLLGCTNFIAVPTILRDIRKNTIKRKHKKKVA